ncbi:hypothetical protein CEXT_561091 [Caerostris extrusa]|uniref:Uncharacterized protein n=1 Tax=Caerostris extrusa TaxID=172846 RepID=A0AAV4NAV4_CAEEX|nr:hypothetical protein CEXT_561091 [Caerostris extrusa]
MILMGNQLWGNIQLLAQWLIANAACWSGTKVRKPIGAAGCTLGARLLAGARGSRASHEQFKPDLAGPKLMWPHLHSNQLKMCLESGLPHFVSYSLFWSGGHILWKTKYNVPAFARDERGLK